MHFSACHTVQLLAFSALTLLVGRQAGHTAGKKTEWWGAGVIICLERDADLHMAQLMPLLLIVSCFSKIQIGFTFLVLAHPGSPGQRAVKRVCVCVIQFKLPPHVFRPTFLQNNNTQSYALRLSPEHNRAAKDVMFACTN